MTNKDRYQRAFAPLRSSTDPMEVWNMKKNQKKKRFSPKMMLIAAIIILMAALTAFGLRDYITLNFGDETHILHQVSASGGQEAYIEEDADGPIVHFAVGKK